MKVNKDAMKFTFIMMALVVMACSTQPAPPGFQLEAGFRLQLVASEPVIKDPVDFEFNEHGEAMILEMPGYPFEDQQSRIVILKDGDHDGVYESSQVFAEGLQLATSFLPYKKGVLVAAPPYLLHVKDLNGDQKADAVDTLMGGFSTGNLQHNYNGLTYGLDNWIYAANGGNSGQPYWWNDTTSRMDLRGDDFRIHLETKTIERIGESSGGFGLAMDEWGHVFETHNLTHISHLVFPDRYRNGQRLLMDHTLENISDHEENGLARIYPIGEQESRVNHPEQSGYFSGSCGVTYYGGGALGSEYDQTIWVADVVLNLIHVDKLNSKNSSFQALRVMDKREFLASTDRSFRPVNMTVGPDGALYVVDMYRQVIEHPEWIPDEIEKTLDLNAGKDKGRIYRIARKGMEHTWDVKSLNSVEGMIANLSHSNQWIRIQAQRLLMDTALNEGQFQSLINLLQSPHALARVHTLWILQGKQKLDAAQLLTLLTDPAPGVRENALIVAEGFLPDHEKIYTQCLALLKDSNPRVRMQAALTISTLEVENIDSHIDELLQAFIDLTHQQPDPWQVAALTLAAGKSAPALLTPLIKAKYSEPNVLKSLALASGTTEAGLQTVLAALAQSTLNSTTQQAIIQQLTQGRVSSLKNSTLIRALEINADDGLIAALAGLRRQVNLPPSPEFLTYSRKALMRAGDASLPDSVRLEQLALLELLPYSEKAEVLYQCLENTQPLKIQEAALLQLSKFRNPEIGYRVVKLWPSLGPHTRRYASDLLLYIETNHEALLTGLENGTINIGEMNFDLERRRMLLWWTDNQDTQRRAQKLFTDAGVTNRSDAIEKMKPALALAGSAGNGEKVFESICGTCHVYGGKGKDVGPVLTEINRKSKESLLHDILDPNAAADTKYINHRLETTSGELHMGIVDAETDTYITIKKMGGEKVTVNKRDIKTFRSLGTSLMMEGLENSMTHQELADLLAFLQNPAQ